LGNIGGGKLPDRPTQYYPSLLSGEIANTNVYFIYEPLEHVKGQNYRSKDAGSL